MPMHVNPYLVLDGNAMEAIRFYEKALDAKVGAIMTFGQMPQDPNQPPMPEAAKGRVGHAVIKVGDTDIMFSDTFPGQPYKTGDQVTISITTEDADQAKRIFEALKEGARQVMMPLQKTFWSPAYAMLTDKFGITFHISAPGQM